MSPTIKLQGLALVAIALVVQSTGSCTLTSDSFNPIEATGSLGASDAGSEPGGPSDPSNGDDPSEECREGTPRVGCDIGVVVPSSCDSDADCESQVCVEGACAAPTCSDSRQNGDESGVDCGGDCPACDTSECDADGDCESNNCQAGSCLEPTCDDERQNQGEAAVDCAGPCSARCAAGETCTASADCGDGLFCPESTRRCTSVSCQDDVQNGDEIETDCGGGTCPGCPVGTECENGADCITLVCGNNDTCVAATCNDDVRNQGETGEDCGGPCQDCPTGQPCNTGDDCQSGVCGNGGCGQGGAPCCQAPSCNDNRRNGTETDTDCGGNDAACRRCPVGDSCDVNADCASGSCINGACANCNDGVRNGTESDTDCGGVCGDCAPGDDCGVDGDCQTGVCEDGRCCGGVLVDCTRCAQRLATAFGSSINCSVNGAGAVANCEAFLNCLSDNPAQCPVRHAPGCSDEGGVCNHNNFGSNTGAGIQLADAILGTSSCTF